MTDEEAQTELARRAVDELRELSRKAALPGLVALVEQLVAEGRARGMNDLAIGATVAMNLRTLAPNRTITDQHVATLLLVVS